MIVMYYHFFFFLDKTFYECFILLKITIITMNKKTNNNQSLYNVLYHTVYAILMTLGIN